MNRSTYLTHRLLAYIPIDVLRFSLLNCNIAIQLAGSVKIREPF